MRRRLAVALAPLFVGLGAACVDLFHSTDFETLCQRSPSDPRCGDADADAGAPDAPADTAPVRPDFCKWTSAEAEQQALRACAWLGACEGPLGESAFGPCAVTAQLAFDCAANPTMRPAGSVDAFWGCMATVRTCADVDRCVFPGALQECEGAQGGGYTACGASGNERTRLSCNTTARARAAGVEPCVMLGKTCAPEDTSVATCSGGLGIGGCTTTGCSGTNAVDCNLPGPKTFDRGIDCAGHGGARCIEHADGPLCAPGPAAEDCSASDPPTATCEDDGGTVTSCVASKKIRIDCARLGLACDVGVAVPSYAPGQACVRRGILEDCVEDDKCVGTVLRSCGRGALKSFDCAKLGFTTCTVDENTKRAACGPRP